jgi:hypothetical protein
MKMGKTRKEVGASGRRYSGGLDLTLKTTITCFDPQSKYD